MSDQPGLHVTDIQQREETVPDGSGGFVDHVKVSFTTPSGTRRHVRIPVDQYTPSTVAAHIAHHTALTEGVHALEGQHLNPPQLPAE